MRTETALSAASRLLLIAIVSLLPAPAARAEFPFVGLSSVKSALFTNEPIAEWAPQADDYFAFALATGDFNNDGADDLATGIPFDNGRFGGNPDSGLVVVRWGIPGSGLSTAPASTLVRLGNSFPPLQDGSEFGYALASCDFDGDSFDDLAVGAPRYGTGVGGSGNQGYVLIHYGSEAFGIDELPTQVLQADGPADAEDQYGTALAAGDFDGDGYCDLAVGSPFANHDLGGGNIVVNGGDVEIWSGSAAGLVWGYVIDQSDAEIPDSFEADDYFGQTLAAGDFNGDQRCGEFACYRIDDLAIGVPGEDGAAGKVLVVFGSLNSLLFGSSEWYGEGSLGGTAEAGDFFTESIAAGDFNGDGSDDLILGAPQEDLGAGNTILLAGALTVIYGSNSYFNGSWFDINITDHLTQETFYGAGASTEGDYFGWSLATGDFNGDGRDDAAVGHRQENVGGVHRGGFTVMTGDAASGLGLYYRYFAAGVAGTPSTPQDFQSFGSCLASGDFDGNGHADLIAGTPNRDVDGIGEEVGDEVVLYGALFADGFDSGNDWFWIEAP